MAEVSGAALRACAIGLRAVEEARGWIGTPYRHQCACKGAGSDCLGLLRGVWRALYGAEPEILPAYTPDWAEAVAEERLWAGLARHMGLVAAELPLALGQVVLFRMREGAVAKHLGIVSGLGREGARFIHAYSGHGVVESGLTLPWQRRMVARFLFPEGAL